MKRLLNRFKFLLLYLIGCSCLNAVAQQKDGSILRLAPLTVPTNRSVNISGNIKRLALLPRGMNTYTLSYIDLATGKKISHPIKLDTNGNFSTTIPLHTTQQFRLVQQQKIGEQIIDAAVEFFFYAKPGGAMELKYFLSADRKVRTINFKGDLAELNNQDRQYQDKLDFSPFRQLIDFSKRDSVTSANYRDYEAYVITRLDSALAYNAQYFSSNKSASNLQNLADADMRYTAANLLLLGAIKANVDARKLDEIFMKNKINVKDSSAFSNSNYKLFLHSYYVKYVQDVMKKSKGFKSTLPEVAAYVLKTYPKLTEDEKDLAKKVTDTVNKIQGAEKKRAFDLFMTSYNPEYIGSIKTKMIFEHLLNVNDPDLRDIFVTKHLTEAMDTYGVVAVQPLIDPYDLHIRPSTLRDIFLKRFASENNRVFKSKLSVLSTLSSIEKINPDSLVTHIKNKYKGKAIFIDVWASWCKPCLLSMPASQKLREKLKDKSIAFVYLCIDSKSKSQWRNLIASNAIEGDNYFLDDSQSQSLVDEFYITKIPRYIIIDRDGNVRNEESNGPSDQKTFEELSKL